MRVPGVLLYAEVGAQLSNCKLLGLQGLWGFPEYPLSGIPGPRHGMPQRLAY